MKVAYKNAALLTLFSLFSCRAEEKLYVHNPEQIVFEKKFKALIYDGNHAQACEVLRASSQDIFSLAEYGNLLKYLEEALGETALEDTKRDEHFAYYWPVYSAASAVALTAVIAAAANLNYKHQELSSALLLAASPLLPAIHGYFSASYNRDIQSDMQALDKLVKELHSRIKHELFKEYYLKIKQDPDYKDSIRRELIPQCCWSTQQRARRTNRNC